MTDSRTLDRLLVESADRYPRKTAVEEAEGGAISYRDLADIVDRLRDWLVAAGVRRGDRVGIYLRKSIDSVASIFGILMCGAAYVPVDPTAPSTRNSLILCDCQVRAVIVERQFVKELQSGLNSSGSGPKLLVLDDVGEGAGLVNAINREPITHIAASVCGGQADGLAYLLYTSGSTGKPKGVMISHRNAMCFVNWCTDTFEPLSSDRFSSHAPFHFDLSILDLFVPIKHGATVVLFGENIGKEPVGLAQRIAEKRISVWYSAPSILSMLTQQGNLDDHDFSALRMILFAGEVFPVKHLRSLKSHWPEPRCFNLYGPTETNVCTWYEVPPEIPVERDTPFPIGRVCDHYIEKVIDPIGEDVLDGSEGELCIAGPGVMQGYWNLPEQNARVFFEDGGGKRWYRTGDVVLRGPDGEYTFLGRRDRMIKKRGYRVELGEIEAALYQHPQVKEAAVISLSDDEANVRVRAFVSTQNRQRLSLIEVKRFCADRLPLYMVPDLFTFLDVLPRTSTDKIDYQKLAEMA